VKKTGRIATHVRPYVFLYTTVRSWESDSCF